MKNIFKSICLSLYFYAPLLQAMQQEVCLKIESLWETPIEKSCCCTECCLGCLDYFCGKLSNYFKKNPRNENVIVKFTETIGIPFYEIKKIVEILNEIDQKIPAYLRKLSAICQGPIEKFMEPLSQYDAEQLSTTGINLSQFFQTPGIYRAEFVLVLQMILDVQTFVVKNEKSPISLNSIKITIRIRTADELYTIFLERRMLYHATKALEEYLHFTKGAIFFNKPISRRSQQSTKKITTPIGSFGKPKKDSIIQ